MSVLLQRVVLLYRQKQQICLRARVRVCMFVWLTASICLCHCPLLFVIPLLSVCYGVPERTVVDDVDIRTTSLTQVLILSSYILSFFKIDSLSFVCVNRLLNRLSLVTLFPCNESQVRIKVLYEGESNENLKYSLNTIYCAEVVQSCITFQHNLPHAQCKSSSAYKVHKFL